MNNVSGGLKNDAGKPRMELLDWYAMEQIARVLSYGAEKYTKGGVRGEHNWRKGLSFSRLLGAVLRHLFAYLCGEDKDPETGLSHLAHAGCGIMFLLWHEKNRPDLDDRYKPEPAKDCTVTVNSPTVYPGNDDKDKVTSRQADLSAVAQALQDAAIETHSFYGGGSIDYRGMP